MARRRCFTADLLLSTIYGLCGVSSTMTDSRVISHMPVITAADNLVCFLYLPHTSTSGVPSPVSRQQLETV